MDVMESKSATGSGAEFQAVIIAGGVASSELYPMTDGMPAALLPVANRPLLGYQLELLEKSGFSEVIVVGDEGSVDDLRTYIEGRRGKIKVDLVESPHEGTADMLRHVAHKLTSDFMVLSGDLVTEGFIHHLADVHRIRDSTITMLVKAQPMDELDSRGRVKRPPLEDLVGINEEDSRVVYLESAEDVGDKLEMPKGLLKRCPSLTVHTNLADAHCYVFSHWVLALLEERPKITDIKYELVPHLVRRQFLGAAGLPESLVSAARSDVALANSMSASADVAEEDDLVRCFALVLPADGLYCARAKSHKSYADVNREVIARPRSEYTPWPRLPDAPPKFRDCLVAEGLELGARASLKKSVLGAHCKIGAGAKLLGCILMDHVTVGDNCVIQNSILCRGVVVEKNCNINECQIGHSAKVVAGSRLKDEQVNKERSAEDFF